MGMASKGRRPLSDYDIDDEDDICCQMYPSTEYSLYPGGVRLYSRTGIAHRKSGEGKRPWMSMSIRLVFAVTMVSILSLNKVCASCTKGVTELWAYTNPSDEVFHDSYTPYISSNRGALCRWLIIGSNKDWRVSLKFDPFELKNATKGTRGDCLEIYDGKDEEAPRLQKVCGRKPHSHTSTGRYLFIIYQRGNVRGKRKIGFVYKAVIDDSKEELIKIASIVGGCLVVICLFYFCFNYTRGCKCLRQKDSNNPNEATANTSHPNQERDRLTVMVAENGERDRPTPTVSVNGEAAGLSSTQAGSLTPGGAEVSMNQHGASAQASGVGEDSGSDSESLHTLNEPPPSYESLYLTEEGGIEPPEYSPPKHKIKNPPRRVHTFN